jgi:hypothetical protein
MDHVLETPQPLTHSPGNPQVFEACLKLESIALSRLITQAVASAFGISELELRASTRRCAAVSFARQVAMYLAHVACGYSLTEVGILFDRDRTTAAYACRKIEDRRDDPDLDFCLDCLESAVRGWEFQQNSVRQQNDH